MGKSKTVVQNSEQQTNTPPSWAQPGLEELGARVTSIIPTIPGPMYTGDFLAQPSAYETQMPEQYNQLSQFIQGMVPTAMGAMDAATTPVNFNMTGSPQPGQFSGYDASAIQPVIQAAIAPAYRQLTEQILPSLQSSGMESGAYSSDRALRTLPGMALDAWGRNAQEIGTGVAYQDFSDYQNRMLQAYGLDTQRGLGEADVLSNRLSLFPGLMDQVLKTQSGVTDAQAAAAAYDRQLRQSEIDNNLAKFDYGIKYPFQGLDVAAALLGNLATPWGTRTTNGTQTTSQGGGGFGQLLQAGMGLGMAALGMPGGLGSIGGLFKSQMPTPVATGGGLRPY